VYNGVKFMSFDDTVPLKDALAPIFSIAVNVPKFFEAEVAWHDDISQLQVQASNLLFMCSISTKNTATMNYSYLARIIYKKKVGVELQM
jgi:hypothetical protein